MDDTELEGKTALITGSVTSTGRACALALASAGADVVLGYLRAKGGASDLIREIHELGRRAVAIQADVSNSAEVSNLFLMAEQHFGGVDILVNNAGPYSRRCLMDLSDAEWEDIVEPNLYGTFYCCREAIPYMRENHWGRIINVTFEGSDPAAPTDVGPYAIARVAVVALTRTLALEEAANGITVNALGSMLDDMGGLPEPNGGIHAEPPLRVPGAEELRRAVRYLASPRADSITGAHLILDGVWQP